MSSPHDWSWKKGVKIQDDDDDDDAFSWTLLLILYVAIQVTGHIVSMELLNVLGLVTFADQMLELVRRLKELNLDINECVCLKFVILLNPG